MISLEEERVVGTASVSPLRWLGLAIALVISGLGIGLGIWQHVPAQQIIFYAVITFALVAWIWNYYTGGRNKAVVAAAEYDADGNPVVRSDRAIVWAFVGRNRAVLIGLALLLLAFGAASITIDGFFSLLNAISFVVLAALLILTAVMTKFVVENKSAFIGLTVLVALIVVGSLKVDGFVSAENIKSMLLFASFLGLACVGQTLVALLGGLDLSIPFVIGAANVGLLFLMGLGLPSWLAVILILLAGILVGLISGFLSFWLQGQALILTLGVGFAVSGLTQILTSIGTRYSGNVFGSVPGWLTNLAAMNGTTFGLDFPPVILIWVVVAALLVFGMKNVVYGRYIYALGGNRTAAQLLSISERRYWVGAYTISGGVSAMTGALLLGWSGGGFIGVGQPYLFMTLAAVVVGGTSLLGGVGGYGFTVIGVLVLQVLTSFLVGIGLSYQSQQFIFGLLVVPMVALYARSPHIRTQV
jgi:ribose transport system permease protein